MRHTGPETWRTGQKSTSEIGGTRPFYLFTLPNIPYNLYQRPWDFTVTGVLPYFNIFTVVTIVSTLKTFYKVEVKFV